MLWRVSENGTAPRVRWVATNKGAPVVKSGSSRAVRSAAIRRRPERGVKVAAVSASIAVARRHILLKNRMITRCPSDLNVRIYLPNAVTHPYNKAAQVSTRDIHCAKGPRKLASEHRMTLWIVDTGSLVVIFPHIWKHLGSGITQARDATEPYLALPFPEQESGIAPFGEVLRRRRNSETRDRAGSFPDSGLFLQD